MMPAKRWEYEVLTDRGEIIAATGTSHRVLDNGTLMLFDSQGTYPAPTDSSSASAVFAPGYWLSMSRTLAPPQDAPSQEVVECLHNAWHFKDDITNTKICNACGEVL